MANISTIGAIGDTAVRDPKLLSIANSSGTTQAASDTSGTLTGNNYVATTQPGAPVAGTGVTGAVVAPVNPADSTTVNYNPTAPTQALPSNQSGSVVQGYLNDLLSQDSAYMRNAQQQGLNQAASRGLRNSSIAVGAAQASNIQNAQPILNNIMSLNNQREQQAYQAEQSEMDRGLTVSRDNANMAQQTALQNSQNQQAANLQNSQLQWQAEQAALDRTQGVNNKMLEAELASKAAAQDYQFKSWLQDAGAKQQDWLNSNQYSRELSGLLSQMQLNTASDLYSQIVSAAINNPQTFPPEVAAGMQNYFTGNWAAVLGKYFPSLMGDS